MGKEQDLLDASRSGQLTIVEKILSARIKKAGPLTLTSLRRLPGPNTTDPRNGFTCLHYASLNGHKDIVRLLLEHGANPNIVDHNGSSPLHLASWTGDYEVVDILISNADQRADINLKNKDNETALHSASQYGHTAVASLLLSSGADPFIRNIRNETPLDLSAQYGRLDTIELLLRMRFDLLNEYLPGRDTSRAISFAAQHSPLHLASRNGHKSVVKLLLDLGFDVDYLTKNGTALHEAVLCGKVEVARLLLSAGSDIELKNDKGQKVEELLNGLNTSVAKQTKQLIEEHMKTIANRPSVTSPISEATTLAASNSFCDQEDLTIVDSMLNEDMALYNHDYDDLMDDGEVQCISPPPGYTDATPDPVAGLDIDCVSPTSSLFSASIFSELASIFDEHLNRTSGDERVSHEFTDDELIKIKPSTSFTLSDYRANSNHSHNFPQYSNDKLLHHQSFDTVYTDQSKMINANSLDVDPTASMLMMSSSLHSNSLMDHEFGELNKYNSDKNRDSIISSNYSLSSAASSSVQSYGQGESGLAHKPRPPKPPRKSIELSKAKSVEYGRGVLLEQIVARSDFNLDYQSGNEPKEDDKHEIKATKKNELRQRQQSQPNNEIDIGNQSTDIDLVDSDHSTSQHLNSVISNELSATAKKVETRRSATKSANRKEVNTVAKGQNETVADTSDNNRHYHRHQTNHHRRHQPRSTSNDNSSANTAAAVARTAADINIPSSGNNHHHHHRSQQQQPSITLAQSIDDFYMLYDQVAKLECNNSSPRHQHSQSPGRGQNGKNSMSNVTKHSSLDMLESTGLCPTTTREEVTSVPMAETLRPPSADTAETEIFHIIEPLKQQFYRHQPNELHKKTRRKKKKDHCGRNEQNSSVAPLNESFMTNGCDDGSGGGAVVRGATKRDNWTLASTTFGDEDETTVVMAPPVQKKSIGVSANIRMSRSLVHPSSPNRCKINSQRKCSKNTSTTTGCDDDKQDRLQRSVSNHKRKELKSDYYNVYCETLKLDRKGEKENPFAGLCRGGLAPTKTNHQQSHKAKSGSMSEQKKKKKTVELSETRKSLRRQRNILSGRAESLTKLTKLSIYCESGTGVDEPNKTNGEQSQYFGHSNNIYATLRKNKKKSKSLNGDSQMVPIGSKIEEFERIQSPVWTSNKQTAFEAKSGTEPRDGQVNRPKAFMHNTLMTSVDHCHQIYLWLKDIHMHNYKDLLIKNGYDNLNFMDNNVMDDSDLLEIGIINASHREVILKAAQKLDYASVKLTKSEINTLSVEEWLARLQLDQYSDIFHKNGITELRKIRNIWEVELETMLEVDKVGHRRRIMFSLSEFNRQSILMDDDGVSSWLTDNASTTSNQSKLTPVEKEPEEKNVELTWKGWKHARQELVNGCCQYTVCYLGSTLVRELRGIDSTRASIGKLKVSSTMDCLQIPKIFLVISCQGVQFKDFKSNKLICEHEIRNIHCICQDSEDLNYFAYITKDFETNQHYCHVFMSQQTDLVTEIILTLGQAFEIAYQIVLEQYNLHAKENVSSVTSYAVNNAATTTTTTTTATSSTGEENNNGKTESDYGNNYGTYFKCGELPRRKSVDRNESGTKKLSSSLSKNAAQTDRSHGNGDSSLESFPDMNLDLNGQSVKAITNDDSTNEKLVQVKLDHDQAQLSKNKTVDSVQSEEPVLREDLYAVVDKSRKNKNIKPTSHSGDKRNESDDQHSASGGVGEQKPVPPIRSSSTVTTTTTANNSQKPEIKPKPPLRVASIQKPEVSPKPKNLLLKSSTVQLASGPGHQSVKSNLKCSTTARPIAVGGQVLSTSHSTSSLPPRTSSLSSSSSSTSAAVAATKTHRID